MANPKQAHYHQYGKPPQALVVVKEHEDGTVDLAAGENHSPVITACVVSEAATIGTCTLIKPPAKGKKEGKQPAAEEKAAFLTEAKKQLAAFEEALAKDPANVNLNKRTEELRAAVEDLSE